MAEFIFSEKNIFEEDSLDVLINPVNCKGVPKTEISKDFAFRFPRSQKNYVEMCKKEIFIDDATGKKRKVKAFQPGDVLHYTDMDVTKIKSFQDESEELTNEDLQNFITNSVQDVIYFPVKNHWKRKSKIDYVKTGVSGLKRIIDSEEMQDKINFIGIPKLSSELNNAEVVDIFKENFAHLNYTFIFFFSLE